MTRKYKSKHARVVHDIMRDANDAGAVDKRTMRQFDATCLTLVDRLSAAQIKKLRAREGVSQAVLAAFLALGLRLLRVRLRQAVVITALFLLGYSLLVGGRPPVMKTSRRPSG
jgi:putative transcriptional regulator